MSLIKNSLLDTYKRLPVSFEKGEGVWLFDKLGNKYLDGLSGVAVNTLGHNHPALVKAISKQASKLIHISNYYHIINKKQPTHFERVKNNQIFIDRTSIIRLLKQDVSWRFLKLRAKDIPLYDYKKGNDFLVLKEVEILEEY